jgi:hypothetical protein
MKRKNYRLQELDSCAVAVNKPHDASNPRIEFNAIAVWQQLRGGSGETCDTALDQLCGTTNVGGNIKAKIQGDNAAATSSPDLHKRQSSRRKHKPITCQQALAIAERKRDQYLARANEQAAKPYYDGNATISASNVSRLLSDLAKLLADIIEDIEDVDPALRAKAAKKIRAKERKGYGVLRQIDKKRAGVLPNHTTGYSPGEPERSAVKAYLILLYTAAKAVKLITKLEKASRKLAA